MGLLQPAQLGAIAPRRADGPSTRASCVLGSTPLPSRAQAVAAPFVKGCVRRRERAARLGLSAEFADGL